MSDGPLTYAGTVARFADRNTVSSFQVPALMTAEVGALLVARVGSSAGIGETPPDGGFHQTLQDSAGNVWTKLTESASEDDSKANAAVSLWYTVVQYELPGGGTFTVTLDDDRTAYGLIVYAFELAEDAPDGTITVTLSDGFSGAASAQPASTPLVAPYSSHLWIAGGLSMLASAPSSPARYVIPGWTVPLGTLVADGDTARQNTHWFGYVAQTGRFTALSVTGPNANWAVGVASLRVTVTPISPVGTREYEADFETATARFSGTSAERRPDAVSRDYLTAVTAGPEAVDDATGEMYSHRWRVRYDTTARSLYLARSADPFDEWQAETPLAGHPWNISDALVELDACFDRDRHICVVAEVRAAATDAPSVWLYWFDYALPLGGTEPVGYRWHPMGAGRSPRICCDWFELGRDPNICPPDIDVHVVYMGDSGLVRRSWSEYWDTAHAGPIPDIPEVALQSLIRTDDRRLSVLYSERDVDTGRYRLARIDSEPFVDSALPRPRLRHVVGWISYTEVGRLRATSGTYYAFLEFIYDGPMPAPNPLNYEVEGADSFGPITDADFYPIASEMGNFSATSGNILIEFTLGPEGATSPCVLRVRFSRLVNGVRCYSPWRYAATPRISGGDPLFPATLVNCQRDRLVRYDTTVDTISGPHALLQGVRTSDHESGSDPYPIPCGTLPYVTSAPPGYWFIGGARNYGAGYPNPTHDNSYSLTLRAWTPVDITDAHGRYVGAVYATIYGSSGSGVVTGTSQHEHFPFQFPTDEGLWPTDQFIPDSEIIWIK